MYTALFDGFKTGSYVSGNSLMHKMNGTLKLFFVLIILICIFFVNSFYGNVIYFLLVIFILLCSGINYKRYFMLIWSMKWFLILIAFINIIFGIKVSVVIIMISRVIVSVLLSSMLIFTTTFKELVYGIFKMISPLKIFGVDINGISLMLGYSIRFIPVIFSIADRIFISSYNRGVKMNGSLSDKLLLVQSFIVPLFMLSINKSETIAVSMDLRFAHEGKRDIYFKNKFKASHLFFCLFILFLVGVII